VATSAHFAVTTAARFETSEAPRPRAAKVAVADVGPLDDAETPDDPTLTN
jgi:hypothetical protein